METLLSMASRPSTSADVKSLFRNHGGMELTARSGIKILCFNGIFHENVKINSELAMASCKKNLWFLSDLSKFFMNVKKNTTESLVHWIFVKCTIEHRIRTQLPVFHSFSILVFPGNIAILSLALYSVHWFGYVWYRTYCKILGLGFNIHIYS